MQQADEGDGRWRRPGRQYRSRGAAMGVRVGAAATRARWVLRMIVPHVGDRAGVVRVIVQSYMIHLFVRQRMRVGKLRGMQDRHLAAAEHGHGKQRRDHDMFDDPLHGLSKPGCSCFVKPTPVLVKCWQSSFFDDQSKVTVGASACVSRMAAR